MWPNKFFVAFLSLIAKLCAAGIILKLAEPKAFMEIDKAAINVITSCYRNRGNAIAVGGNVSRTLVKTLSSHQIPIVLVHSTSKPAEVLYKHRIFRYRLQAFVMAASNVQELRNILITTRGTVWWNHMAPLLILYRSPLGCHLAETLMKQASTRSIFNAKLICFDRQLGARILGYTPYGTEAPEPWRLHAVYLIRKKKFTVFERPYQEGKEICKNLDFDKTKNLNGHPIELLGEYHAPIKNKGKRIHITNAINLHANIMGTIVRDMNATIVRTIVDYTVKPVKIPVLKDIYMATIPLEKGLRAPVTQPFMETGLVVMTQYRGNMSQLQKLISVIDIYSRIGLCIVFVFTLMFFKLVVDQALMPGILNIVRILCNTGFMNLPRNTPARIYLASVLMLAVTMHGIYQGKLASILTNEVSLPNVNTWQDLIDLGHTIYAAAGFQTLIKDPILKGRVVTIGGNGDCSMRVINDSTAACVYTAAIVMDQAEELNLHLSNLLSTSLQVYMHRPDWPLQARFNFLLGQLFEADILLPFYRRMKHKTLNDFKLNEDEKKNKDFRNITLRDLSFAFVILGIGLVCATVTFILEIIIHRMLSTIRTRPVHSRTWFR